jgi:hypothetical protein
MNGFLSATWAVWLEGRAHGRGLPAGADGDAPLLPGCGYPESGRTSGAYGRRSAAQLPQERDGQHSSSVASVGRRDRIFTRTSPVVSKRRHSASVLMAIIVCRDGSERNSEHVSNLLTVSWQGQAAGRRQTRFPPNKRVFRRSNAFGRRSNAFGRGSNAFGRGSNASGRRSNAFGHGSNAFGRRSNAFGRGSNAFGRRSNAFGRRSNAFGRRSNAFGRRSNASFGGRTRSFAGQSPRITTSIGSRRRLRRAHGGELRAVRYEGGAGVTSGVSDRKNFSTGMHRMPSIINSSRPR